jgi:hypothetical protein
MGPYSFSARVRRVGVSRAKHNLDRFFLKRKDMGRSVALASPTVNSSGQFARRDGSYSAPLQSHSHALPKCKGGGATIRSGGQSGVDRAALNATLLTG